MSILVASTFRIQRQIPDPHQDRPRTVRDGAGLVLALPLIVWVFLDIRSTSKGAFGVIARASTEERDGKRCNKWPAGASDYRTL